MDGAFIGNKIVHPINTIKEIGNAIGNKIKAIGSGKKEEIEAPKEMDQNENTTKQEFKSDEKQTSEVIETPHKIFEKSLNTKDDQGQVQKDGENTKTGKETGDVSNNNDNHVDYTI